MVNVRTSCIIDNLHNSSIRWLIRMRVCFHFETVLHFKVAVDVNTCLEEIKALVLLQVCANYSD